MYSKNIWLYFAMHRLVGKQFKLSSTGAKKWKITKNFGNVSANQSLFSLF